MTQTIDIPEMDPDLAEVLGLWNDATLRLQQTHEVLQGEVRRLTEELEVKNRELARKNRLADLGQMASHIAHEVRNGLVPITLYLSLLKRKLKGDESCCTILGKLQSGFSELDTTVNDLLHFSSDRQPNKSNVALAPLTEELCRSIMPQFQAQEIHVYTDVPEELHVNADREMLRRGLLNLLLNAIDAMHEGGELIVRARVIEEAEAVEISVCDNGCGFSEESLKRAAEPFYSTKGTGTGLGLAIVCRIVEVHGGVFSIENHNPAGAVVKMCFPE